MFNLFFEGDLAIGPALQMRLDELEQMKADFDRLAVHGTQCPLSEAVTIS